MALHRQAFQRKTKNESRSHFHKREKLLYELSADATLSFEDGQVLHVSKALLAFKSEHFHDIFFGSSSPVEKVKIKDFDRETFQLFLDCWFGLKEYSALDALLIYPIAHKYGVKKCLQNCVSVLKPTKMNENVCLSLNLALFYECHELINEIMTFFRNEVDIVGVLENPTYYNVLEPGSVRALIEHVDLNLRVWKIVLRWAENNLKSGPKGKDVHSFLAENKILEKLSLSQFKSFEDVIEFIELTDGQILDSNEVLNISDWNKRISRLFCNDPHLPLEIIKRKLTNSRLRKGNDISTIMDVESGTRLVEIFVFKNTFVVSSKDSKNGIVLNIRRNGSILMQASNSKFKINCKVRLNFRYASSKKDIFQGDISSRSSAFCSMYEDRIDFFGSRRSVSLPINISYPFAEISSVELIYTFSHDCKIWKTPISENDIGADKSSRSLVHEKTSLDKLNGEKSAVMREIPKLYFTKSVLYC